MSLTDRLNLLNLLNDLDKDVTQKLTSDDNNELREAIEVCKSILKLESYLRRDL